MFFVVVFWLNFCLHSGSWVTVDAAFCLIVAALLSMFSPLLFQKLSDVKTA